MRTMTTCSTSKRKTAPRSFRAAAGDRILFGDFVCVVSVDVMTGRLVAVEDATLSDVVVPSFKAGNSYVVGIRGMDVSFTPKLDEETNMFTATREDLGIEVFASTRDELVSELNEQLAVNWLEYAKAEDSELTKTALRVKRNLLAHYREVV